MKLFNYIKLQSKLYRLACDNIDLINKNKQLELKVKELELIVHGLELGKKELKAKYDEAKSYLERDSNHYKEQIANDNKELCYLRSKVAELIIINRGLISEKKS